MGTTESLPCVILPQVHAQPDTQRLKLSSGGGSILLYLDPGTAGSLRYPAAAKVALPPELLEGPPRPKEGEAGSSMLRAQLRAPSGGGGGDSSSAHGGPPLSRLQQAARHLSPEGRTEIELQPGGGWGWPGLWRFGMRVVSCYLRGAAGWQLVF